MEKKYSAELPDYEDHESYLVDEMLDCIKSNGGLVRGYSASEENGYARIIFLIKEDSTGLSKIEEFSDDMWVITECRA